MRDALKRYIAQELLGRRDALGLADDDDLLGSGVDSVGMMSLVLFIEEQWELPVPPEDVTIENFQTVERIESYLRGRRGASG